MKDISIIYFERQNNNYLYKKWICKFENNENKLIKVLILTMEEIKEILKENNIKLSLDNNLNNYFIENLVTKNKKIYL